MSKEASTFEACDRLVREFENVIKKPMEGHSVIYYMSVDLEIACVMVLVLDEDLRPVAGSYRYADVVGGGTVADYIGVIRIVGEMKEELEKRLGTELVYAIATIPPGTDALDPGTIRNVVQGAGFEIIALPGEPTVANTVLNTQNGAMVDIRGGTTDISVLKGGKVVYVADEPTGGTHFPLVISGVYQLSLEEADVYKRDQKNYRELPLVSKPAIEKVFIITNRHIGGRDTDRIYSVGGTCCLTGTEGVIEKKTGTPTCKPANPTFVMPLGVVKSCASACG